jgi:hypothetical protein
VSSHVTSGTALQNRQMLNHQINFSEVDIGKVSHPVLCEHRELDSQVNNAQVFPDLTNAGWRGDPAEFKGKL